LKAVFDTNIFISAFIVPGGQAEDAFLLALKRKFTLYSSISILAETAQKLTEKFGWQENNIEKLINFISKIAIVIKTEPYLHVLSDEPDNRILECAAKVGADFIVTGDKHLLSLQKFQGISILGLSDFLEIFKNKEVL
jgi:putative PIN family toxin of toxin-antitoxin system